jgi:hypothetical protein
VLTVSECFDTYCRFAAERQRIFHGRADGIPPPWTADPILGQHKFTSVRDRPRLPAITATNENDYVVPGPGALDGISKCFTDTDGLSPAELITWMRDTSPDHLDRLGLRFQTLWGRWPTLIDWQNVLCEVSKYTATVQLALLQRWKHSRGAA